ncbi:uncharacterized protein VICG_01418 [Vittaforma corneae ATCC 50505]|uniref:Proteasome subunit beta n=1 Tax=Vittaforma corneae (strain ATCC 50505) TaxID=993615 RepID=L2GLP3_VITCO|nr:uncharacterized protein VICG_01418 [Vittaforma corneae ATCC 50505]ELA41554.1 hypothetical protein VICG_01418 [Vittaforma corneae ATCC 50505]
MLSQASTFSLENDYSINKKTVPEPFKEEQIKLSKNEANFINEEGCSFASPRFVYLQDVLLKSKDREVSEEDLYENNGGTSLVVTTDNKIIIASDTRHSSDYTINSRKMTKIFKIGEFYLATTGFFADSFEVYTNLMYQVKQYETYSRITLKALAHLLHNLLYSKRFFPYYSYAILCGFDNGTATVYSYDPVGSYDKTRCRCNGSSSVMIQPLLDSWIMGKNFKDFKEPSFSETLELVKKAFDAASERDVKTKDYLEIYVIEKDSMSHELIPLRKD